MRLFLDVISRVEDSHMWEPRRKFWLGLYEEGRISEAWVAFSFYAKQVARQLAAEKDLQTMSFGEQVVGGGRNNTSLLIMRVGKAIVVEGSHSYKVHVFRSSDPSAPALYRTRYDCDQIRLRDHIEAVIHSGNWQGRVKWAIDQC